MAICAVTPLGKQEFGALAVLVHGERSSRPVRSATALAIFERVALHDEIQVADAEAGQHVAHGAAGQEQVDVRLARPPLARSSTTRFWSGLRWLSSM